jgi:TRAP-type mannitol/chloroaromatic compound transport system permease small subunit
MGDLPRSVTGRPCLRQREIDLDARSFAVKCRQARSRAGTVVHLAKRSAPTADVAGVVLDNQTADASNLPHDLGSSLMVEVAGVTEKMARLFRFVNFVNEWIGRTLSVLIFMIVILIIVDVVARSAFSSPIAWSFEVTTQLYATVFMMLGGYTLLHNSHVSVDVLSKRFASRTRNIVEIVCYLTLFFPFVVVLVMYGYRFAARSWAIKETTWGAAAIPVYPIKSVIVISGVLLLLQGLVECGNRVAAIRKASRSVP